MLHIVNKSPSERNTVDGCLRSPFGFELQGSQIAKRRMNTFAIVDGIDEMSQLAQRIGEGAIL